MNNPRYKKDDVIINFRDMLIYILRRWRNIVIGVLAVGLLAVGYRYLSDWRSYQNKLNANQQQAATITLDGVSLANANQVLQYEKVYQAQADYNRNAPLMQINPGAVKTQTLTYLIEGARSYVIAQLYQTHLGDVNLYTDIADHADPVSNTAHIAELVSIEIKYDKQTTAPTDHALVCIDIIAPTDTLRENITHTVKAHIVSLQETVSQALGAHKLTLMTDALQTRVDTTLKNTQQSNLNACNTLRTNLKNAKEALTDEEKAYLEQAAIDDTLAAPVSPNPPSVSKKWLVLGVAAGLALMLGIYVLGYIFGQKLKSRTDLAERYELYIFGRLTANTRPSLTERTIRRLFCKKEAAETPAYVTQQLLLSVKAACADNNNGPSVLVTGSALDDAMLADMVTELQKEGIRLTVLADPVQNPAAPRAFADADAVVLAETAGRSTYDDIYRTLDMCARFETPVLGAFIIE